MTTAYALLLDRCGLSHREAAEFHRVRLDTVRSWSIDRNPVPPTVFGEVRRLYASIERAAAHAVRSIPTGADELELGLASDDAEARRLGLPCVGAHRALLGLVAARVGVPVRIVPRGTTVATAAAADAHDR